VADWMEFAHTGDFTYNVSRLKRNWAKLHAADALEMPSNPQVLAAWALFHSGRFKEAVVTGVDAGPDGFSVVCKATCVYASYLEASEKNRQVLFQDIAKRASDHCAVYPDNASAFYWHGYALGRYSQGISVAKALAQGVGGKVKNALEAAVALDPGHADAYVALAAFHSEVINKVGALIGNMTYGVRKDTGLALFSKAISLCPSSPHVLIEAAHGRLMLEGEGLADEADALYRQAMRLKPRDAHEKLLIDLTRRNLSH
jgi:tetratricopeptide (TPR) repeat protein